MTLDIVCKVVDNYGDIGVAYRLARALSALPSPPRVRLVVDDLRSFARIEPLVDPEAGVQSVRGMAVLAWNGSDEACRAAVRDDPPRLVIECFACGRPDWLEFLLFDEADGSSKTIVNLEYLTAEDYADECHRLPSLTRSSLVRKHMFLPGFTPATGGLILDGPFMRALSLCRDEAGRLAERRRLVRGLGLEPGLAALAWTPVFSYERDYARIVGDLAAASADRPLAAFVASGRSEASFLAAWEAAGRPFPAVRLPFLAQEDWDAFLAAADFSVVRGEDSLSRAALAGRPFLWHAYPQAEAHQLVKVRALLGRMRPHFDEVAFADVEAAFLAFNDRLADSPGTAGEERVLPLVRGGPALEAGFRSFADALLANGDLALHLMTFLAELV